MGTDSLKRQVPLPGAAAEIHFLFWNCGCTRSFPHPQGPEQPFAVAACRLCCAPCMLSPECWHAALPSMGHCILPPCCLSARLHLSALSAETAQDMLEHRTVVKGASGDRLITIPATARGEIFDRQGHPRAFKDAERRGQEPCHFLPNKCHTTDSHTLCPPGFLRAHWEHSDIHQLIFLCHLTSGFRFWDVSC